MIAISVKIKKADETDEWVKYAFGNPSTKKPGTVVLYKIDGKIELIDIEDEKYKKYLLPGVREILHDHHLRGEYPAKTSYHA